MKLIDLLNKIANDTLANGTKIVLDNELYIYNKKGKKLEVGTNKSQYRIFSGTDLNKIVEVIPVMEEVIEEEKEIEEIPIPEIESSKNERILRAELKINELVREVRKLKNK